MNNPSTDQNASFFERLFFLKSVFARLLLIILLVGGGLAATGMVKESQPDLQIATAIITTAWPGGDAQTIEQEVTNKLETELKNLKGLKRTLSGSFSGFSIITVEFQSGVDPKDALSRLQSKVSQAEGQLPRQAEKPSVVQASINDQPIYSIRLFGDVDLSELSKLARRLQQDLERLKGVNEVNISGDLEDIVMIRLIGARLNALEISPLTVRDVLQQANVDMPWGSFDGEEIGATFRFAGRFRNLHQLRTLPIVRNNGRRLITLEEVAEIRRTNAEERTRTFFSDQGGEFQRAVEISITKRAGEDTIEIINGAKELLGKSNESEYWPSTVDSAVVVDESENISADLQNVIWNGWQAMLAVFIILFFSLTWREALVAGLAIPVSFAGGLILIALLGYSLNQIVIIGMVIALGLLVDVFILMMEGMHENIFVKGKSFSHSALATVKTYAAPALSGQLTTMLAMAPLLGITGIVGEYIRPMPMTAIMCLIMSYIVALLLAIPLSRYVLPKPGSVVKKTKIDIASEKVSGALGRILERVFLRSRWIASIWVSIAVVVFVFSFMLFSTLPFELMPKDDGRNMGILIELEPNTSMKSAQSCADSVGGKLRELEYFDSVTKYVGEKSPFSVTSLADRLSPVESLSYVGFTTIFSPKAERDKLGFEYVPEVTSHIQSGLSSCQGGKVFMTPELGGASAEAPIQIDISGDDMQQLREIAERVVGKLESIKGAINVRHNLGLASLDIQASPKSEAIDFYGITANNLAEQIRIMMTSDVVGKYVLGGVEEDIDIRMGFAWPSRSGEIGGPTTIEETYLLSAITPSQRIVPLSSLVNFELSEAALTILHKDNRRTVTVLADTDNRTAGEILASLAPEMDELEMEWPDGYDYYFAGESESSEEVFGSAGVMLILALFLVFALLVLQFDSFKQPVMIMFTIPLAMTGTFLGFFILKLPFSFMAMIGVIALIGIVVNNAIVMIDTMNKHRQSGKNIVQAASQGASDRLRPIITTSITTICGMIPLALSQNLWLPLGTTVISGLMFATILSLLIIPCLYILLTSDKNSQDDSAANPL